MVDHIQTGVECFFDHHHPHTGTTELDFELPHRHAHQSDDRLSQQPKRDSTKHILERVSSKSVHSTAQSTVPLCCFHHPTPAARFSFVLSLSFSSPMPATVCVKFPSIYVILPHPMHIYAYHCQTLFAHLVPFVHMFMRRRGWADPFKQYRPIKFPSEVNY